MCYASCTCMSALPESRKQKAGTDNHSPCTEFEFFMTNGCAPLDLHFRIIALANSETMKNLSLTLLLFMACALSSVSVAFVMQRSSRASSVLFSTSDFWRQRPGESNSDFYKRIQKASSDPTAFENFVTEYKRNQGQKKSESLLSESNTDISETNEPKKGYQRAEDWDADQKKQKSGWDEKVQFDGRRYGNGFNQNEILRHHLKGF